MRKQLGISVIALTLAIGFVGRAEAQRRRGLVDVGSYDERHGFWLNLGLGAGQERSKFADEINWSDPLTKPTGSIIVGGTVSPNLRVGVQLNGWADSHYDQGVKVTDYLGGLLLVGQFYPSRRSGFYLKGGGGFSRVGTDVPGPGGIHEDGFGWTAGLGYELRVSRNLFLTPMADFYQHRSDVRDVNGVLEPALYDRLITIGVALTIQSGRH